jgi:anti-sigma B factor antagonist
MEVTVKQVETITVVALVGDIDGSTAPVAQAAILEQITPGHGLIVDMSSVNYMSSAGLRMLLSAHRSASAKDAKVVLVGLSEDLQDTMAATGFLDFFSTFAVLPAALEVLTTQ